MEDLEGWLNAAQTNTYSGRQSQKFEKIPLLHQNNNTNDNSNNSNNNDRDKSFRNVASQDLLSSINNNNINGNSNGQGGTEDLSLEEQNAKKLGMDLPGELVYSVVYVCVLVSRYIV